MPIAITHDQGDLGRGSPSAFYLRLGSLNLGVYATGGVPVTKANFDFANSIVHVDLSQSGGRTYEFDKTAGKIKAYRNAAGAGDLAEVANATDLSATPIRFMAFGK